MGGINRRAVLAILTLLAACGSDDSTPNEPVDEGAAPTAGCTDGTLSATGALYRTCFPANWNGEVVLYAHGYVSATEPLALPSDNFGSVSISAVVNGLGYGFATTSYRANGIVVNDAVEDVVQLKAELERLYKPDPAKVWLVGVSEGGLVAALSAERHPEQYAGALAACGPIGDFVRQVDYIADFRVVFDHFFPGVLPGHPVLVPDSLRAHWSDRYVPAIEAAFSSDTAAARQVLAVTGAPGAESQETRVTTALEVLRYDVFVSVDVIAQVGGQPYDNTTRQYAGSDDDAALNQGVARIAADPAARAGLQSFQTTGAPGIRVSAPHTTGDPIIPFVQESLYAAKVAAQGASSRVVQSTVERYGHCTFTLSELLAAFNALTGAT